MKLTLMLLSILTLALLVPFALAEDPDSGNVQHTITTDSLTVATNTVSETQSLYPISDKRRELLFSYSSFINVWRFVDFFVGLAILCLILFTGLSAKLRDWAGIARLRFFVVWLYLILFIALEYLIHLPFHIYRSFVVEDNYGFMNQSFFDWFKEDLLGLGITAAFMIIPMWFLYLLIAKSEKWWLKFTVGSIPFLVAGIVLVPVYIQPLFNTYIPIEDKALETELLQLASSVGIENPDVFQVNSSKQTTKVNAYVTGLFNTKRIVLYDNMINNFTYEEIKFVMGHEMGHYVMNHIWMGLSLAIFLIAFSLWLTNKTIHNIIHRFRKRFGFKELSDIASLPLLLIYLTLISFFMNPVSNSFSRWMERESDIYGMEHTDTSGESAAIAFDKLSVFNLSDPDPNPIIEFWFYSHPALSKRMEFVRNYR